MSSLVFLSSSRLSSSSSCTDADRNDSSTCGGSSGSSSSSRLGVMRQAEEEVLKARQAPNTEEGAQIGLGNDGCFLVFVRFALLAKSCRVAGVSIKHIRWPTDTLRDRLVCRGVYNNIIAPTVR